MKPTDINLPDDPKKESCKTDKKSMLGQHVPLNRLTAPKPIGVVSMTGFYFLSLFEARRMEEARVRESLVAAQQAAAIKDAEEKAAQEKAILEKNAQEKAALAKVAVPAVEIEKNDSPLTSPVKPLKYDEPASPHDFEMVLIEKSEKKEEDYSEVEVSEIVRDTGCKIS